MSKRNALTAELKVGDEVMVITDGTAKSPVCTHYAVPGAVGKVAALDGPESLPIGVDFGPKAEFEGGMSGHRLHDKIKRETGQWLARTDLVLMPKAKWKAKVKRAR